MRTATNYCRACPKEGDCQKIVPCKLDLFVLEARTLLKMMKVLKHRNIEQRIIDYFVQNYGMPRIQAVQIIKEMNK